MGYVEDDETPEAIMKKFEALERVQQATTQAPTGEDGGAADGAAAGAGAAGVADGLTEEQLQEVFKQTSVFTVKSATAGPEFMYGNGASRPRPGGAPRPHGSHAPQLFVPCRSPLLPATPDGNDDDDMYRSEEDWCARAPPAGRARARRRPLTPSSFPAAQGRGRVQRLRRPGGRRGRAGVAQAPRAGACPHAVRRVRRRAHAIRHGAASSRRAVRPARAQAAEAHHHGLQPRQPDAPAPQEGAPRRAALAAGSRANKARALCTQVVDPYELVLLKLPPPPLAASWGRMIQPYCPAAGAQRRTRRVVRAS